MIDVPIPKPAVNDYERTQFATEWALTQLLSSAARNGLLVEPVMGLMYLPDEKLTTDFQTVCRAMLLTLTPKSSHVIGSDGKDYFAGEEIPG